MSWIQDFVSESETKLPDPFNFRVQSSSEPGWLPGKDGIYSSYGCALSRNIATKLGHDGDESHLFDVRALSSHVRTGDDHTV